MTRIVQRLADLASTLEERPLSAGVLIVGIDGPGGAGKSSFARALALLLREATVIEFDDFYRPSASRLPPDDPDIGGNFEWRRLREQVLLPLSKGQDGSYQRYDWVADAMATIRRAMTSGISTAFASGSERPATFASSVASREVAKQAQTLAYRVDAGRGALPRGAGAVALRRHRHRRRTAGGRGPTAYDVEIVA